MEKKKNTSIDISAIVTKLLRHKKLLIRNLILAGIIFSALILCVPRYYTCEVKLAPEFDNASSAGSLASIASSFGFNLGGGTNNDAISPSLYPDLMESKDFLVTLFPIKIKTSDGELETDYYTYLQKHQKRSWWDAAMKWVTRSIKKVFAKKKPKTKSDIRHLDPSHLSEEDFMMAESISRRITCSVDRKNYVITIMVKDQDPLVCATIADSTRMRLQQFITRYRTSKARVDLEFYEELARTTKADYEESIDAYSRYADSHRDMILQSYISERDQLENEAQMKFSIYSTARQQLEAAKAKVQERTPAFTILKNACVPPLPTGPKRVSFVLGMMFLVFLITSYYIINKDKVRRLRKTAKPSAEDATASAAQ